MIAKCAKAPKIKLFYMHHAFDVRRHITRIELINGIKTRNWNILVCFINYHHLERNYKSWNI